MLLWIIYVAPTQVEVPPNDYGVGTIVKPPYPSFFGGGLIPTFGQSLAIAFIVEANVYQTSVCQWSVYTATPRKYVWKDMAIPRRYQPQLRSL